MEFKGISWVGNVYQKFEDMCLEVEEAMYQDTVKYVENQVQKVGFSVKKFISVVTEDLVPPSCAYPVSLASGDLSLNSYCDIDVIKKPIPCVLDSHHDLKKKEHEDQVISNSTTVKEPSVDGGYDIKSLSVRPPGVLHKISESRALAHKKFGVHRSPIGIRRISRNNQTLKDSCQTISISGDIIKCPSGDMRSSSSVASDVRIPMPAFERVVRGDSGEAVGNASLGDAPIKSPASDKVLSAESVRQNEDDQDRTSPASGKPFTTESKNQSKDNRNDISPALETNVFAAPERLKQDSGSTSSCSALLSESTGTSVNVTGSSIGSKTCSLEAQVMVSNEGTSMKGGSSISRITPCGAESCDKEIIKSNEDEFEMEMIEDVEDAEPREEESERETLDESCVMVEGDNLHTLPQGTRKSYKKKLREALLSKLRSRKDRRTVCNLVGKGEEESTTNRILTLECDQKQKAPVSFESDWELL